MTEICKMVGAVRRNKTIVRVLAACALLVVVGGCRLWDLRKQMEFDQTLCALSGSVRTDHPSAAPLIVVLVRMEQDRETIADHYVLEGAGRWRFDVLAGSYALAAFADVDSNGIYEEEPALPPVRERLWSLRPGQRVEGIELVIPRRAAPGYGRIDIAEFQARSIREQNRVTAGQLRRHGEIAALDDARFDERNGKLGLWDRFDFVFDVGFGIFFLEPCDPGRTPVLFVHGMTGGPRGFSSLVGVVDREHYQPWFYYYPSGYPLDAIADELAQEVPAIGLPVGT